MTNSQKNLMAAFAGESQANRKYLAFAKVAEKEGYAQIAKLFRAAAEAETIHAHYHLRTAGKIGTTAENLKEAVGGETFEFTDMYPKMIAEAEAEGDAAAKRAFTFANEVEKVHADLYKKAMEKMGALEAADYLLCSVCGYTCENEAPEKCPVCGALKKVFLKAE